MSAKRQVKETATEPVPPPLTDAPDIPEPAPVQPARRPVRRHATNPAAQRTLTSVLATARHIEAALLEIFEPLGQKWGIGGEQGVGLTLVKFNALMALYVAPEHTLKQNQFKELFAVTRANITRIVKDLERDELIVRTMDETDNRYKFIHLTPRAVDFMNELLPLHNTNVERLAGALSADEQQTLAALLRKMRDVPNAAPQP